MKCKLYLLDNFDSFSYNLVDEFAQLGCEPVVYRNDIAPARLLAAMENETQPVVLVLSPGPGAPSQAGNMMAIIDLCKGRIPMLGICLGHQALTESYGGQVGLAGETVHGKSSTISLDAHPVFSGLGSAMPVARYHSLIATKVPGELDVIARYGDMPMAVCHVKHRVLAYQFHPESILTPSGTRLLRQSLEYLLQGTA